MLWNCPKPLCILISDPKGIQWVDTDAILELRLNFRISIVLHEIIQTQNSIMQLTEILRPLLQIIFSFVMAFFSKNVLSHYSHHDPMFHFQPLSGTVACRQSEIENKRSKELSQLK
jgi:hypothetical protein